MQQSTWNPSKCRICGWFASWKWWIFHEGSTGCSMHFCSCLEVLNCLTPANLGIDTVLSPLPVISARGGAEVVLGISSKTCLIYRTCMRRAPARPVRAYACVLCAKLLQCCCPRTWPAHDPGAMQRQANTFFTLHTAPFTLHTCTSSHLKSGEQLFCTTEISYCQREVSWTKKRLGAEPFAHRSLRHRCIYTEKPVEYFVLQSLHKALPSTNLYYKACTKHFTVLLCTTKLAQSTCQYYFVLQSLHKVLPSTTLYYQPCTKHFPVLLCTTKLAQGTFLYYFVLQSTALPSTTLYCKACKKYFLVLLCTTKLAQSTFQYYFVLQSLHKALPSTTLYYKAFTKHVPILQSLHKALPSTTLYYKAFTKHVPILQSLHKVPVLLCTTKLAQNTFPVLLCTRTIAHNTSENTSSFDTQQAFPQSKLLHTASFCYTKNALTQQAFTLQKSFYTKKAFTHRKLLHTESITQSKLLHKDVFT